MPKKQSTNKTQYDIITISHYFYPRSGGLERMAYGLLKELTAQGWKCLAIHGANKTRRYQLEGVDCISLQSISLFDNSYPLFGWKFAQVVRHALNQSPKATVLIYDRHLLSSVIAAIVCKLKRRKYILVAQTTQSNYFNSELLQTIGHILDKTVFKWVLRKARLVVSVSNSTQDYLIKHFGLRKKKGLVIYNYFDPEEMQRFAHYKKQKLIAFAAKWSPVKDPNTTAKAFMYLAEKYPDWKFVFAGKGDSILKRKRKKPKNLHVISRYLPKDDVFKLVARSSIYVNSSLNEGLSVAILEATSMGNIPVLSDAPSNVEVASKLNTKRYIFKRKDVHDLIDKLEKAIAEHEGDKKQELPARIADKTHRAFAKEAVIKKYSSLLNNWRK